MTEVLDRIMRATTDQSDDARLVERLKSRDKTAMEDVVRLHGGKLYGVALQIMRNETSAREAMQDALLTIWNKIGSFEGRSAFTSWMHRVTANAALMRLRKEKRFEHHVPLETQGSDGEIPLIQLPDLGPPPDVAAQRVELGARVRAAIDALPEPYRVTVLLSDVNGLSPTEIAEATDATVAAVRSRLHRGRLALREVLQPYLNESNE